MRFCVKKTLFARKNQDGIYSLPTDIKGDFSFIDLRFWQSTEEYFYKILEKCRKQLSEGSDLTPLKLDWLKNLRKVGNNIFDDLSQTGQFEAADPKRIALAWNDLRKFTSDKNRKLREILILPKPDSKGLKKI